MTEDDILRAGLREMAETRGERDVSLSAVAESLACRKQSLYSYFSSKRELVEKCLDYGVASLEVPSLKVNFTDDVSDIFRQFAFFYVDMFSQGVQRDYLSAILVLSEKRDSSRTCLDDIIYMIESQAFFILFELSERGRIGRSDLFEYLSHMTALCIMDMIIGYSGSDRASFEAKRLASFLQAVTAG